MTPAHYAERRPSHRRSRFYYRRCLGFGALVMGLGLILAVSHYPRIGPGLWANMGLTAGAMLALWSLRQLAEKPATTVWGRAIRSRMEDIFPAALITLEGFFGILFGLLIWFAVREQGIAVSGVLGFLALSVVAILPLRRILAGTEPPEPSAQRIRWREGLDLLHAVLVTWLIASALVDMMTPSSPTDTAALVGRLIVRTLAVLITLFCAILFLDLTHRKLKQTP